MRVFLLGLLTSLWLMGCASVPSAIVRPPASEITQFALLGRLAVRQGEARYHVNIDWRHTPASDEILLATPLGQGVAEILRSPAGAQLTLADKRSYAAADMAALAEQVFGFPLPLTSVVRWLLGANDVERLLDGWAMRVVERESAAEHALPTLIELERDDVAVRLKITEWTEVE
jgi:outer membrane lipoprotein LolB